MKILYMSISYLPEKNGLYQNLVNTLISRGHDVTIVRSLPDIERTMYENKNDLLKILTVKTADPFSSNLIRKGINQICLATFFKNAIKKFLSNEKFDMILYATPPVTLAGVVKFCKNKYNAKTFLMLKDIFPQNAVDLGMMKKESLLYNYFRNQEKKYYNYSDYIGCMSQGNKDYVIKHNPSINSNKVGIFPNSLTANEVDGTSFHKDKTVFLFGGNLGKPQNIEGMIKIIKSLKNYLKAEFVIVGAGSEQQKVIDFIKNEKCENIIYKDFMPQAEYENILKSADVGLISLDPRFTIPNIPSKFQNYLKLKKPVLAITDNNTDIKNMILENNCGWWCDAAYPEKVIDVVKEICENKDQQILKGNNGRRYFEEEFDVEQNVDILEKILTDNK